MRPGSDAALDLSGLQPPLGFGSKLLGSAVVVLLGATVIGIPYLITKWILVRRGEIAIAESISGNPRVLGVGALRVVLCWCGWSHSRCIPVPLSQDGTYSRR